MLKFFVVLENLLALIYYSKSFDIPKETTQFVM